MFHTPLADVTYEQLINFCESFPEGVRVEYKRDVVNVPKIVSSFANTVGGIWVIGVETDNANRAMLPPTGLPKRAGTEEQIIQSSLDGIYPAIIPGVRVLDIPDKPAHVVVIVKVPESLEAPHAIENSTKVYVRVASTTPPYDLADIDRIDYLLKRRQEPERRREELVEQMAARSAYAGYEPKVRVVIAPVYPRGIVLPMDDLLAQAESLRAARASPYLEEFRLVHSGIMSTGQVPGRTEYYFEAGTHGIVFFEERADIRGEVEDWRDKSKVRFTNLGFLLRPLGRVVDTTLGLLKGCVTNILIRYELFGLQGIAFLDARSSGLFNPGETARHFQCLNTHLSVSVIEVFETVPDRRVEILVELMRQALWAFNYTSLRLRELVDQCSW